MTRTVLNVETYKVEHPGDEPGKSYLFEMPVDGGFVDMEVRCAAGAQLFAINLAGEQIFLASGSVFSFRQRIENAKFIELVPNGSVAYSSTLQPGKRYEKLDPTPLTITVDRSPMDDMRIAVRAAVAEQLAQLKAKGLLKDVDVDVDELVDDMLEDTFTDDDDSEAGDGQYMEDEEGLTPMERLKKDLAAKASSNSGNNPPGAGGTGGAPQGALPQSGPPAGTPPAPAGGSPTPGNPHDKVTAPSEDGSQREHETISMSARGFAAALRALQSTR